MKNALILALCATTCLNRPVLAEITKGDDCDGKCEWVYDSETQSLTIQPKEGQTGSMIIKNQYGRGAAGNFFWSHPVEKMVLAEGITGIGSLAIWQGDSRNILGAGSDSVLVLPSTIRQEDLSGLYIYCHSFETIDASALENVSLSVGGSAAKNVIVDENSGVTVSLGYSYDYQYPGEVTVLCKGTNVNNCAGRVSYNSAYTTLNPQYYKGYDENGNIIEEWGPNGKSTYKYDNGGNMVAKFGPNGERLFGKKIYTIEEAEAATAKGDKFHVSLTYK